VIRHKSQDCTEVLLDLICYEVLNDRLSPEMEGILADHLAECAYCRTRFLSFRRLIGERTSYLQ
jgi:hypothetical protein